MPWQPYLAPGSGAAGWPSVASCLCVIKAAFVSEIKKDFGDTGEEALPGLSVLNGIPSLTDLQPTLHRLEIPKSTMAPQSQFCLPEAPSKPGVGQVEKGRTQSQGPQLTAQGEAGQSQPEATHSQNTSLKEQSELGSVTFRRKKGLLLEKVCVSSGVNPKTSLLEILE